MNDEKINLSTMIKQFFERRGFSKKYIEKWQRQKCRFIFELFLML